MTDDQTDLPYWHYKSDKPCHPFCRKCGWRRGGIDSWDGQRCKCGISEPPYKTCITCGGEGGACPGCDGSGLVGPVSRIR